MQRVTASALLLLGPWFLWSLMHIGGFGHEAVLAWVGRPSNAVMLLLLSGTLAWHSSLGVQVVIEDYVHSPFAKVLALLLSRFGHVFVTIVAAFAIVRISLVGSP